MNLIQMMNPTNDSIGAAIRPQYEKDVRLRSALRMTAVSMEEQSHMIAGGRLVEVAESTARICSSSLMSLTTSPCSNPYRWISPTGIRIRDTRSISCWNYQEYHNDASSIS